MTYRENMIKWITELKKDGMTYAYNVSLKPGYKYDIVKYCNRDEKGCTVLEEFRYEWLPKAAKSFIEKHAGINWTVIEEDNFTEIRYR